jgi:translation elongation factor EF-4
MQFNAVVYDFIEKHKAISQGKASLDDESREHEESSVG